MADVKISALPAATTPLDGTEILPIVQGGITEQVSVANLTAGRTVAASTVNVDANSASAAVRITQTGAGNALVVEDSANPDATPFVIDSAGRVVVGDTTAPTAGGRVAVANTSADTSGWYFDTQKIRGTAIVNSGDSLGGLRALAYDGASYRVASQIESFVDGTPGTNDMPGRLVFSTTADGASSPTERMRIDNAGQVGIGATPGAGVTLYIGKNATGGTSTRSVGVFSTIQSDSTTSFQSFRSSPSTAAAAFTLTELSHFAANQAVIGAGSSITSQYGFNALSSLTGATNNYGFYGNIASGAGRWNFFANGTANNAFAGNSRFGGVTAPVATVDVTGSVAATTTILSSGATNGIGYATGAGGAVTQGTSRTTGVTLNNVSGAITLFSAAGSASYQSFTVTNSAVAATDTIIVNQKSGTDKYIILVTAVAAGSFQITFATTGGTTTEQPVFNFAVIKAVAA